MRIIYLNNNKGYIIVKRDLKIEKRINKRRKFSKRMIKKYKIKKSKEKI